LVFFFPLMVSTIGVKVATDEIVGSLSGNYANPVGSSGSQSPALFRLVDYAPRIYNRFFPARWEIDPTKIIELL
jgi:hypothetical protein